MAQGFARFYRRFWADEKVRQLEPEEKLVAAYVLTGQSNRIGLFRFSVGMAEDDLGLPRKRLLTLLDRVCHTLSWGYDPGPSVILIRSWWRWNPPDSDKTLIGYLKEIGDVPKSKLLAEFRANRDTLSDRLWDTLCDRLSMPEPMPEPKPEPEPEPCLSPSLSRAGASPELEAARGAKPTLDQVKIYCAERKSVVDPERWLDYQQANGWRLSNGNPLRDWQASIRTWERNGFSNGNGKSAMSAEVKRPCDAAGWWDNLDTELGNLVHEPEQVTRAQTLARRYVAKHPTADRIEVLAGLRDKAGIAFEQEIS